MYMAATHPESHSAKSSGKLNSLRAAVLGANDGIVSVAGKVAQELTEHDAFAAHADAELRIDPHALTSPWQAAVASAASFFFGAVVPLAAIVLSPAPSRLFITFASVILALIITGVLSAMAGGANRLQATVRVVLGGIIAMAVTYGIGKLIGPHV
jgi:VIT1/CCC1 family predicted Fe2+/Mn2+ transporter